jgi:hypothetical protein
MKATCRKSICIISMLFFLPAVQLKAQAFETAVSYMDYITKAKEELTTKYLVYLSAMSHGKSARKVEKRRNEVVNSIIDTRSMVSGMPPWKGDRTLKDTTISYLKILYIVFNEDYGKIVNMEEIAEQSYDGMEAYMLAQEKAQEKLEQAAAKQKEAEHEFAGKNNIRLIEGTSDLEEKSKIVSEVMDHVNAVYLVFFKSYKQDAYLNEAIKRKDIVAIEQNISSLEKFSTEGLSKLKAMKGYKGDASLINACRDILNHYKAEVSKGPLITDYFLKEESFQKIKKQFDNKPSGKRTQQDIDQFNNAVNDINYTLNNFNAALKELNRNASAVLNNWNKTHDSYLNEYMPKQRK